MRGTFSRAREISTLSFFIIAACGGDGSGAGGREARRHAYAVRYCEKRVVCRPNDFYEDYRTQEECVEEIDRRSKMALEGVSEACIDANLDLGECQLEKKCDYEGWECSEEEEATRIACGG